MNWWRKILNTVNQCQITGDNCTCIQDSSNCVIEKKTVDEGELEELAEKYVTDNNLIRKRFQIKEAYKVGYRKALED